MLPEASQDIKEKSSINSKNTFIENLRVSPEELAKNIERQQIENVQTRQNKRDELSLDD